MGKTFDTSAMDRSGACSAKASAARRPAPPAPTIATSMVCVCVGHRVTIVGRPDHPEQPLALLDEEATRVYDQPVSSHARALVTEAEFLALPESTQPLELVDGEIIVAPSPRYWHQEVLARIVTALRTWAGSQPGAMSIVRAPTDVRFASNRILQPDAMVFLTALPKDSDTPLQQIPEICIEVLSTNRAYDRITKRYLYAESGVQEYWIVDPAGTVERRSGSGLSSLEDVTDRLRSPLLPGFELYLAQLFA